MRFLPYQWSWINDKSRLKILVKSRRIGGSFATAYLVFRRLVTIPNHDVIVITRDQLTAMEFVRDVGRYVRAWNIRQPMSKQIPDKCILKASLMIPHSAGESRLIACSSNPDAAAGKGGDLIIDEMALHKDQEMLLTVAKPVITAGGTLSLLSTHRSKSSLFNKFAQEAGLEGSAWSLHKYTMEDAIDQGFVEQVVNPTRIKLGDEPFGREEYLIDLRDNIINDECIWDQEYCCIPSEKQHTLLNWELIKSRTAPDWNRPREKGVRFLGWDIAESEKGDYSVMFVIEMIGSKIYVCDYRYMKGIHLPDQRNYLIELVHKWNVNKICVDAAGIGRDSWRILERKFGTNRVTGFMPGLNTKAEVCSKMLSLFQDDNIEIPDDELVMKDINSLEKIYTNAGNVTYHCQRIDGSHGDGFWALGLACLTALERKGQLYTTADTSQNLQQVQLMSRQERNYKLDNPKKSKFKM